MDVEAFLDTSQYNFGQVPFAPSAPTLTVESYPDNVPAGSSPSYSNGFSLADFTGALQSVSTTAGSIAKTVYGMEHQANSLALSRLQTASAVDVVRAQTAAARDVALANASAESAKASAIMRASQQQQQLQSAFGGNDLVLLGLVAFVVYRLVKGGAR